MTTDYNRLLQEMEEEVDGYNDGVFDAIAQDLELLVDNLDNEYYFTSDVRSGEAAQHVYDWVRKNNPEVLEEWIGDPELVAGHDAVWQALESLGKVQSWRDFNEEDALGMGIHDYESWKAFHENPNEE